MRIDYDLYVNVNLRICAVNQACAQRVGESREAKANAGKHEGGAGVPLQGCFFCLFFFLGGRGALGPPFKVCLYALFCFSGGLLLFFATWPFTAFLSGPHAGPRANVFF